MAGGSNLRELREAAGLTRAQVAQALGVTVGQVSHVENGRRRLSFDNVRVLRERYGWSLEALRPDAYGPQSPLAAKARGMRATKVAA